MNFSILGNIDVRVSELVTTSETSAPVPQIIDDDVEAPAPVPHGTLMYPHLQKFMPPIPSRFVQTREKTQAAISDTYNGDGKVYAALRAAAYVSWEILSFVFTDADW